MPGVVGTPVTLTLRVNLSGVTGKSPAGASVPAVLGALSGARRLRQDAPAVRFGVRRTARRLHVGARRTRIPASPTPTARHARGRADEPHRADGPRPGRGLDAFRCSLPAPRCSSRRRSRFRRRSRSGLPTSVSSPIPGGGGRSDRAARRRQRRALAAADPGRPARKRRRATATASSSRASRRPRRLRGPTSADRDVRHGRRRRLLRPGRARPTCPSSRAPATARSTPVRPPTAWTRPATATRSRSRRPATRPSAHWDAFFTESPEHGRHQDLVRCTSARASRDVPTSYLFYKGIETIFHNGVTGGCGDGIYCPDQAVTRAQMAIFLLKSRYGSTYVPAAADGHGVPRRPFARPSPPAGSRTWRRRESRADAAAATTARTAP